MKFRIASGSFVFFILLLCPVSPVHSATSGGCIPGTYLVQEGSGTQSLWSFSKDGTIHITSSAQGALNFGDGYGAWKQKRSRQAKATVLDFTYNQTPVNNGFPPSAVARVDAVLSFSKNCKDVQGSFELRFFDPETEDPLDPDTDTDSPISDTVAGRRVVSAK
jgi:hypothetical protein